MIRQLAAAAIMLDNDTASITDERERERERERTRKIMSVRL